MILCNFQSSKHKKKKTKKKQKNYCTDILKRRERRWMAVETFYLKIKDIPQREAITKLVSK